MKKPDLIHRIGAHLRRHLRFYVSATAAICLAYCCVTKFGAWGASSISKENITITAPALDEMGPLKIAFFSDIHNEQRLLSNAIDILKEEKPDIIIFGGDLVYAPERFMRTKWAVVGFRELCKIAPTYAILGNHDYEKQEQVERVFHSAGVKLLRNEAVDWTTPAGKEIRIVGLGDHNEGDEEPDKCMAAKGEEDKPVLLLAHDPESRKNLGDYEWDLMLAGHTHGGQLGIPFTDKYISFRSEMPAGLFDYENGRKIYVTRGTGAILDMRFFCKPEVSILTIGSSH
ncbi:MAG: phosphodiesterase YaeI [Akkermansia sp.]|nr:phosphodiesterase YaeI [Akkermansia sp.]